MIINDIPSTLIKGITYYDNILVIHFRKYFTDKLVYPYVPKDVVDKMLDAESIGKFYLSNIKNKFKTMAEEKKKPKKINKASGQTRFIKLQINVTKNDKLNPDWLYVGESGKVYLNVTLMMKPDGEVDQFGNLGMIVQDVPEKVYKADKTIKGPILGNGYEIDWSASGEQEETKLASETSGFNAADDLPF